MDRFSAPRGVGRSTPGWSARDNLKRIDQLVFLNQPRSSHRLGFPPRWSVAQLTVVNLAAGITGSKNLFGCLFATRMFTNTS